MNVIPLVGATRGSRATMSETDSPAQWSRRGVWEAGTIMTTAATLGMHT